MTLTKGCHRAIKQYAAIKGMTMSECLYLAMRYNLHREAMVDPSVKAIFEREGIPFDPRIVREHSMRWAHENGLDIIFEDRPAEVVA